MFLVEKLEVYQKAVEFGKEIIHIHKRNDKKGYYGLIDQALRASSSISLNIAEGNGRWTAAERKRYFFIARGSCLECLPILDLFLEAEIINSQQKEALYCQLETIFKMLNGLISRMEEKRKKDNGKNTKKST